MEGLIVYALFVFVIGTVIGSFLNVLIDRIPRNESIVKSRSHCEHCRRTLAWNDLIPVFSYIVLGGKCRYCKQHIGLYYPVVEALTGLLFVFTAFFALPGSPLSPFYDRYSLIVLVSLFVLLSCLIVIFFTDLKYGIIPFKVVVVAVISTLLYVTLTSSLFDHIFTGLGVFAFFLLLFVITKGRGLGFGDVVYAFLMGFILGFPNIIVGLYVAFLTGAVISLILVGIGRKKMKGGSIPFGPFLAGGTLIGLFWGNAIYNAIIHYLLR